MILCGCLPRSHWPTLSQDVLRSRESGAGVGGERTVEAPEDARGQESTPARHLIAIPSQENGLHAGGSELVE
jgi:hypothetical protein